MAKSSTSSTLPLSFIENVGEYFASIYFDENLEKDLVDKAAFGDQEVKEIKERLGRLRANYFEYKESYVTGLRRDIDRLRATREWHTELLNVLGYEANLHARREHIEDDGFVPVRTICMQGERRQLLVLEMASQLKPIDGEEPDGLFDQRYDTDEWRTVLELEEDVSISPKQVNLAVSALFMAEEAKRPNYILLLAGNQVYLMERDRWFRGSYLRIDLDLLFSTASAKTNYRELLHALISIDSLSPGSGGQVLLDQLNEASHKRAYAVTKDLKLGVIAAVEALVNEAVWYRNQAAFQRPSNSPRGEPAETLTPQGENRGASVESLTVQGENHRGESDDSQKKITQALTNDALRLVYRLLFLFYAESREDLELLPLNDEAYQRGYSLNILRDLEQVRLTTDHSINGYFFDDSLKRLFTLLSEGHRQKEWQDLQQEKDKVDPRFRTAQGFSMRMLDSPLFRDSELEILGGVKFRNKVWQEIISSLSLSKENKKFGRGRISYANLDINQLGSVYEGLLSYRGIFADEELIEVHKAGKPDEGTYLVPRTRLDEFEQDNSKGRKKNEVLLDDDGKIVSHTPGSFVYRLHGRDRQKSASYYTPQSLTYTTVYFALEETRKRLQSGELRASALMEYKILEPAMGAAAFQNEAIDQVAKLYLEYREREQLGEFHRSNEDGSTSAAERNQYRISPNKYRYELQRAKAHIAANNVYGIDLNGTAIELGKLSLWLNVIHTGMDTPFFGHRLGQGNAVVGAWLKVYRPKAFLLDPKGSKKAWWNIEPEAVTLKATQLKTKVRVDINRPKDSVYHFLLPDEGMVAAAKNKLVGKYFDGRAKQAKEWLKEFTKPITQGEYEILLRLSAKLDTLLLEHLRIVERIDQLNESNHEYYGSEKQPKFNFYSYEQKQELLAALYKDQSPYARICLVMDYWCALWFWDVRKSDKLPDRAQYYRDILEILEVDLNPIIPEDLTNAEESKTDWGVVASEQSNLFEEEKQLTMNDPAQKDRQKSYRNDRERIMGLLNRPELFDNIPRLDEVIRLKEQNRFFHQQLEFFEVFALRGGFDLVVGNPPWIKMSIDIASLIGDNNPMYSIRGFSVKKIESELSRQRENPALSDIIDSDIQSDTSILSFTSNKVSFPLQGGMQKNLYKLFIELSLEQSSHAIGILHQHGLWQDSRGNGLRSKLYKRANYVFHFMNKKLLFPEIKDEKEYDITITTGQSNAISSISNVFEVETIFGSLNQITSQSKHLGVKYYDINSKKFIWNTFPSSQRVISIDQKTRILFSKLSGKGSKLDTILVLLQSKQLLPIIENVASAADSLDLGIYRISECHHQKNDIILGIIQKTPNYLSEAIDVVYTGSNIDVANPLSADGNSPTKHQQDYSNIDLTRLPENFFARSDFSRQMDIKQYVDHINGESKSLKPWLSSYRLAFRKMLDSRSERTLRPTIIPPGTSHIGSLISIQIESEERLLAFAGTTTGLPVDFLIKASSKANLGKDAIEALPVLLQNDPNLAKIIALTLRLNCLTRPYSDLWERNWKSEYSAFEWSISDARLSPHSGCTSTWSRDSALRNPFERRMALVEIDVLVAKALGLTLEELILIYQVQFPVLQQNELDTYYDQKGNIVWTCSKGLTGVGLHKRSAWDTIKDRKASDGTYTHTIDPKYSELYGGEEREFFPPFQSRSREADYGEVWAKIL